MAKSPVVRPTSYQVEPGKIAPVTDVYRQQTLDLTANGYKERALNAISEYQENVNIDQKDIVDVVDGSIGSSEDGVKFDMGKAKQRLSRTLGLPTSIDNMTTSQKTNLLGAITKVMGGDDKYLKMMVGDSEHLIGGDYESASGIAEVVNSMSGSKLIDTLDMRTEFGLLTVVTDALLAWGVIEVIDTLIDNIKDSKEKNKALESVALSAARQGDVYKTKHYLEKMGHGRAIVIADDIINALFKSYKIPEESSVGFEALGQDVINLMIWLNPDWDADDVDISKRSLKYYMVASDDMRQILQYVETVRTCASAGIAVKEMEASALMGRLLPDLVE